MNPRVSGKPAGPAPVVEADGAVHVGTALVLFDGHAALGTVVSAHVLRPVHLGIGLGLLAGLALVDFPLELAVEAERAFALVADHFFQTLLALDNILAVGEGTELAVFGHEDLEV